MTFTQGQETPSSKTSHQIVGKIGENAVAAYLKNKGFFITDRNYLRKWGELDIVANKDRKIHFVEVKSKSGDLSREKIHKMNHYPQSFSRESTYRPEENMHQNKIDRLKRILQTYLLDKNISADIPWQFDVAAVIVDQTNKICKVEMLWDIVL